MLYRTMKSLRTTEEPLLTGARTLHTPVLPALPEDLRQLLTAAYGAHGGAERMSLAAWRNLEQELEGRLEHEPQ